MSCLDFSEIIPVLHQGLGLSSQTFHFKIPSVKTIYKFN